MIHSDISEDLFTMLAHRWTIIVCLSLAFPALVLASQGKAPIHKATVITDPGSYIVTKDITDTVDPIIDIQADDVTLDLDGHTISSTIYTNTLIRASNQTNIRITNGKLVKGSKGVSLVSTSGGPASIAVQVDHLNVRRQQDYGIYINGYDATKNAIAIVDHNTVDGESFTYNCFWLANLRDSSITFNVARGATNIFNGNGLWIETTKQTFVTDNVASGNVNSGLICGSCYACNVSRNIGAGNGLGLNVSGDSNTISHNTCSLNTKLGGMAIQGHNNGIRYNAVCGNSQTSNPFGSGITFGGAGSTEHNVLEFNHCALNQGYGIHTRDNNNNCFRNNSTPGNTRYLGGTQLCDSGNLP